MLCYLSCIFSYTFDLLGVFHRGRAGIVSGAHDIAQVDHDTQIGGVQRGDRAAAARQRDARGGDAPVGDDEAAGLPHAALSLVDHRDAGKRPVRILADRLRHIDPDQQRADQRKDDV